MLDYLIRKEIILTSLQNGLTNKGYSFKTLSGLNARLDLVKDIKYKYSIELLAGLIESTNYPILLQVFYGVDNVHLINKEKSEWYLYAINKDKMSKEDVNILRESFLSNSTLIYTSEKGIGGEFVKFHIIFSKIKYSGSHMFINNKWQ